MFLSKIQIAESETARKSEFETTLDYMCQQLEQLAIIDSLPEDLGQLECIVNRAMDVRSAFMIYLATHISHETTPLGNLG